jgi:hypothetical protein
MELSAGRQSSCLLLAPDLLKAPHVLHAPAGWSGLQNGPLAGCHFLAHGSLRGGSHLVRGALGMGIESYEWWMNSFGSSQARPVF